jgi:hypothetical protein
MFVRKSMKDTPIVLHQVVVQKHGSHNQSSHGKKGGGGSGGGGVGDSGRTRPRENPFTGEPSDNPNSVNPFTGKTRAQDIDDAKEDLDNNITGAKKVLDNAKNATQANNARGAVKGFTEVKAALGDKKKMDRVRLKRNSLAAQVKSGSMSALDNDYAENTGYINAATAGLARYGDL